MPSNRCSERPMGPKETPIAHNNATMYGLCVQCYFRPTHNVFAEQKLVLTVKELIPANKQFGKVMIHLEPQ